MMRFWSLGTTAIQRKDGTYCVCAVAEDGDVAHEPEIQARAAVPPGTILLADKGDWKITDTLDLPGLVATAGTFAETWTLHWNDRAGQWTSPEIFDGVIAWSEDSAPRRPVCTMQQYEGLGSRLTRILRLDFGMRRQPRDDGGYDFTSTVGTCSVKYNGWLPPVDDLPAGSLVAAFLSPNKEQKNYAYLKIGSVLWIPGPAAR